MRKWRREGEKTNQWDGIPKCTHCPNCYPQPPSSLLSWVGIIDGTEDHTGSQGLSVIKKESSKNL
jgi:hypothetical protein